MKNNNHMLKVKNDKTSLSVLNNSFFGLVKKNKVSDLADPLKKEIELAEEYLSAALELDKTIIDSLSRGDKLKVQIKKDSFGSEELAVYTLDSTFLGFISTEYTEILKNLMKAGKLINAKVLSAEHIEVDADFSFSRVRVKLVMVDY